MYVDCHNNYPYVSLRAFFSIYRLFWNLGFRKPASNVCYFLSMYSRLIAAVRIMTEIKGSYIIAWLTHDKRVREKKKQIHTYNYVQIYT